MARLAPTLHIHKTWNRRLPPVLEVSPGDEISLTLPDASNGEITPESTARSVADIDYRRLDPLVGPIYVKGARPGDILEVEVLEIQPRGWGWTALLPGFGLLADIYPQSRLTIWDLTGSDIEVGPARFPLMPMLGCVGVAPGDDGDFASITPLNSGGNMDIRYVTAQSRVWLPVLNDGALLSVADGHALQGEGEISGTAIECPVDTVIRVNLVKDGPRLQTPEIWTAPGYPAPPEGYRIFTGVGPSLWDAARDASLRATGALARALGLDEPDAYNLLGILGELRIHEIVDLPNWIVGCLLPKRLFEG